ncbi:MAG: HEAT repeat domain-containing protein [Sandaracinaceae bacterium]
MRGVQLLIAGLVPAMLAACGAGPRGRVATAIEQGDVPGALVAYERVRASEGADADLLGRVAAVILLEAARADDDGARAAALLQLSLAGTAGAPYLEELAAEDGVSAARVGALKILARRGQESARYQLRALADHEDPTVLAASVLGMDAELDRDLMLRLLEHTTPAVRAAAASGLRGAAGENAVRDALAHAARVDPEASVRSAAVRSLGAGGPGALDALRERLSDPVSAVRLSAVSALVQADDARGREAISSLLEVDPSPSGIEAARLVAQRDDAEAASTARAYLRQVLRSSDAGLRSQAGVALAGLPASADSEASPREALRAALRTETEPSVRLSLARALMRSEDAAARDALEALLSEGGMPSVQAASLLVQDGHDAARDLLLGVLSDEGAPSILRRTAARSLARDAMEPDAVRSALTNEDDDVRIYAAGGMLAAAAAG